MRKPFYLTPILLCALGFFAACASPAAEPITQAEAEAVKSELHDRSFRQFEPHKDGDPRKGVLVDFFGPLTLWAQYAEGDYAVNEWEIVADEYRIEKHGGISEVTIRFIEPRTSRNLPSPCTNCIDTTGVTVSIRDFANKGSAEFKVNDPNGVLPSPFPVFTSWTRFSEDEWQNGG